VTRESEGSAGVSRTVADRLHVELTARDVDTVRNELRLRYLVTPVGTYADTAGRFTKTIVLDSANESGNSAITIKKGSPPTSAEMTVSFTTGDDATYPFDSYGAADIWFAATASGIDESESKPVPVSLNFGALSPTFRFSMTPHQAAAPADGTAAFALDVDRSGVVQVVAVAMGILMWVLAFGVASVARGISSGRRKFEFGSLTWMASMLFALVGFRNAAPGVPPFGSLFDFAAFFWAELAVAGSLTAVILRYHRDPVQPT
jgi:hypothetical protein